MYSAAEVAVAIRVTVPTASKILKKLARENLLQSLRGAGTYSYNSADKTLILHVEGSSYPNWEGTNQKRILTLDGNELKVINPTPSVGAGTAYIVWKRVK